MFSGIVERVGVVEEVRSAPTGLHLRIGAGDLASRCGRGSSVSVNGVCLTVAALTDQLIAFDVVPETVAKTNLGGKRQGDRVNLEPSIRVGDPVDGHFVQGHVDGTAVVDAVRTVGGEYVVRLRPQAHLLPFVIPKGSIAIDGVSLTIAELGAGLFSVALIPTTLQQTNLSTLQPGDCVNVETDMLVRTIVHTMRGVSAGVDLPTSRTPLETVLR